MNESVLLSISIVAYQENEDRFSAVLVSLKDAIEYLLKKIVAPVTVTIIDNGHQKEIINGLIGLVNHPLVKYDLICNTSNIGFGCAHNLSVFRSKSKFHLILNPDVILAEDSLYEGINYLNKTEGVSAVTPHAITGTGEVQYLCKRYPSVLQFILRGFAPVWIKNCFERYLNKYEMRDLVKEKTVDSVPLISGCFMLCDRKSLQSAGGFNKKYFLYFEDFALSQELSKHGSLVYLPSMKIQHYGGNSAEKGAKHIVMFIRSAIIFFNSYGWKLF